jgi:hypothetical protein
VRCSLIDEYVKKPSAHGMSTFNGSSVAWQPPTPLYTRPLKSIVGLVVINPSIKRNVRGHEGFLANNIGPL